MKRGTGVGIGAARLAKETESRKSLQDNCPWWRRREFRLFKRNPVLFPPEKCLGTSLSVAAGFRGTDSVVFMLTVA